MDTIDEIEKMMFRRGLRRKDLLCVFGTTARASEILTRRRPLTLAMIRVLVRRFRMSAVKLIQEYPLNRWDRTGSPTNGEERDG